MADIPQNAEAIYTFLRSHGLSANAAAGILGNIYQESGGNPGAGVWPSNWGLIQWTPGSNYFSGPTTSLQTQLNAILSYINANGSIANINANASTPQAAALYFSNVYERPNAALANNATREASAEAVAQAAASGKWSGGGTPTTGSTSGGTTASTPSTAHTSSKTTTTPTATLTSFPGGSLDPLNWPADIGSKLSQSFLNALGIPTSLTDVLKRLGLIILGGLLIIVGFWILAGRQTIEIASRAAETGAV